MSHRITGVEPGSIAAQLGVRTGDRLKAINGEIVYDFLDYQALSASEKIDLLLTRGEEELEFEFEKDEYEPLGLEFESPMMSSVRWCCNRCLFCFVDQLPGHVRETMRVKDDDWRMSLMMGNYVTLTNVSDRELDRIVRRHASPLYISVHCTDGPLRARLLGQPRGEKLMAQLRTLAAGGIQFHTQAVLCPGLNDGDVLETTIRELAGLMPAALSLALVPVGLTEHREGLSALRKYTPEEAAAVLDIAEKWREKLYEEEGTRFVFPSDEFYLAAGRDVPPDESYEDYGQIDDGVGMLRLLQTEFEEAYEELPLARRQRTPGAKKLAIATGKSAGPFLETLMETHPVAGADVSVYALENHFFGSTVTVAGLITGGDLVSQMKDRDADAVLITECMLRDEGDCFLDDMTLAEAQEKLGRPIIPVGRRGEDLLDAILARANYGG